MRMSRSGIRALMELALADPQAIRLEVGEPAQTTPTVVMDAAFADARAGHTHYTSSAGSDDLRAALAAKVLRDNGLPITPGDVIVTHGAMSALSMLFTALLGPGDEVLLPDPEFPNWRMAALAAGGDVGTYPTRADQGFVPTIEAIEAAIGPRTRAILLCSPNNPTGAVYPAALLEAVVDLARRQDLWVISDECYEAITYDVEHVSPATFDTDDRVVTVFSFSKTHAMTGWRTGYLVSTRPSLIDLLVQVAEAMVACPSVLGQRAALAALGGPQDHVAKAVATYRANRDAAVAALRAADVRCSVPDGAFYLLVDVSDVEADGYAVALRLLAAEHVAVAPGETFGAATAGWVRLSLAGDPAELAEGVARLIRFVGRARVARASASEHDSLVR